MRKISVTYRLILLAVAMVLIVGTGDLAYSAKPSNDNVLTVVLEAGGGGSFDFIASDTGGGPFYIGGTLFDLETEAELGDFQCWGWFFTASRRMVTQEYNLGERGTILLAGEEIPNPFGIIGGTGDFKNVRGQAEFEFVAEGVLVHFDLS
ncbi:MAG: hypothetical protein E2P03_08030 [Acidobacteria bacterium]|nr:MAG: hypothetical protein E2P03_08030 [Acidobacteriota bacterium]